MATSKTLTPTNVTIQIPAFTDAPDQRVNSNCIDKEADAINALNSKIASNATVKTKEIALSVSITIAAHDSELLGYFSDYSIPSSAIICGYKIATGASGSSNLDVKSINYSSSNRIMISNSGDNNVTLGSSAKIMIAYCYQE